jgi:hypothetical protein
MAKNASTSKGKGKAAAPGKAEARAEEEKKLRAKVIRLIRACEAAEPSPPKRIAKIRARYVKLRDQRKERGEDATGAEEMIDFLDSLLARRTRP